MKPNVHVKFHSEAILEELEARQLFSGGIEGILADNNEPEAVVHMEVTAEPELTSPDSITATTADSIRQELVFIDTDVENYQQLLNDILAQDGDTDRNIEVILLDNQSDGIEQISQALANYQNLDAAHLISHGSDGNVDIGNSTLDFDTLTQNLSDISQWGDAFTEQGDFLIYGCNLAETEDGKSLVQSLSSLTHTDVAASDDLTGYAELGGDWTLEYQHGDIETSIAISSETQNSWMNVLTNFTVNTTADTTDANLGNGLAQDGLGNTSLRAAIEEANDLASADIISLGAGTYTLSLGEITVSSDITITGSGTGVTIIDGASLSGIFNITSGTVTFNNLTIQNGDTLGVTKGGGINVGNLANVTLDNVNLTGNTAGKGGAINNEGILALTDVTISGNTSLGLGGGLNNLGSATLTNTTISGNSATTGHGGGIYNDGTSFLATNVTISGNVANRGAGFYENNANTSTLLNVTITDNTAISRSGGVEVRDGMLLTMSNTIIAGNFAGSSETDIKGTITSLGNNIIDNYADGSGYVDSDILDVDPLLGALSNNGGPTQSHKLLIGSAAINAGTNTGAPVTDQRGFTRDASTDIGAYEYTGANDAPTVANQIPDQTIIEDSLFSFAFAANTFNDIDGDTLTYTSDAAGWLSFDANTRTFSGIPLNADVGTTTVMVTADDGNGGTVTDTFNIVINNTNDTPTVANIIANQTATEDSLFSFAFSANTFNNIDGDTLTYTSDASGWLSFDANTRTFSGIPLNADVGTTTVMVTADDGNGGTVTESFNIVINNTNDTPIAVSDNATTNEGVALNNINVLVNDTDVDGDTLTVTLASAINGTVTINGNNTLNYTPNNNFNGNDTISYTISDGNSSTDTGMVNIIVNALIDPPIVENDIIITEEDNAVSREVLNQDIYTNTNTENNKVSANLDIKPEPDSSSDSPKTDEPLPITTSIFSDSNNQSSSSDDEIIDDYKNKAFYNSSFVKPTSNVDQLIESQLIVLDVIDLQLDTEHSLLELSNRDGNEDLWNNIDLMRDQMDADKERIDKNDIEIEFVAGTTISLTAGVVSWLLRGGALLSSLLSSVSLFKQFDPLAVVFNDKKTSGPHKKTDNKDESDKVEAMFDGRNR